MSSPASMLVSSRMAVSLLPGARIRAMRERFPQGGSVSTSARWSFGISTARPPPMATTRKSSPYPWGSTTPANQVERNSKYLRRALEQARKPGFRLQAAHVEGIARAIIALTPVMEHLSSAGLRRTRKTCDASSAASSEAVNHEEAPIPGSVISDAIDEVDSAVRGLSSSTIANVSQRYEALIRAVTALLELAEDALSRGVERSGQPVSDPYSELMR